METESLLEGMDISFSVKWEKNLVWKSPSPEMPEVPTEILDKVEAKCNEVFPFLLKRIRVTEDSEKGETKFKFYMK
jgi:hypothetical protein